MWSKLERFGGIGRVVLSVEGENVSLVGVVAWMCAWKLWVRVRFLAVVSRGGAGSVTALRGSRDRLCRLEGLLESVGLGTYPICW